MNKVYFVKAYCSKKRKPFYIRYDYAADHCWVKTYGVKELTSDESRSLSRGNSEFDISNSRTGPQYKCPWCGNKRWWRHNNGCGSITCWDGEYGDVVCGKCGGHARKSRSNPATKLTGIGGSGQ